MKKLPTFDDMPIPSSKELATSRSRTNVLYYASEPLFAPNITRALPVTPDEREARRALPEASRKRIKGFRRASSKWLEDERGNQSNERTIDSVVAFVDDLPECLDFLQGVDRDAVIKYNGQKQAAMPSQSSEMKPKVDGGGSNDDPYDADAVEEWGEARECVKRSYIRALDRALEVDNPKVRIGQDGRALLCWTAHYLAIHYSLKN